MRRLEGRVALITGAARGQGRSHALRLAEEGADVIAVDVCGPVETVGYPLATREDLDETAAGVETLGRRVETCVVDVRDEKALTTVVATAAERLGGIDIVLANAGISSVGGPGGDQAAIFRTQLDVNLTGAWNTVQCAAPMMIEQGRGGAIVLTSSTQGLTGRGGNGTGAMDGYCAAKHGLVGLMRTFAHWLAPHDIRVNTVHPTGVATPMVLGSPTSTWRSSEISDPMLNLMDVRLLESADVSAAVAWLVSDEGRYVTGITLPIDAGFTAR